MVSQIITAAFALENIKVIYGFFPWGRSISLARTGEWDASSVWYYHQDREQDFFFSDPVMYTEEVFFHLKTNGFDWEDWSDLEGLTIGATNEYTVTKILKEKAIHTAFYLEISPYDETNFRMLLRGYIDIFPLAKEVAFLLLKDKFSQKEREKITFHPKIINSGEMYLLFSKKKKKNQEMVKRFNRGLKKLRHSGTYNEFVTRRPSDIHPASINE
ncbi:MAG: transporter substrate-binding domain-containing protein [Desulfobacteraceae bacterium]|nr:transporter substrate-binding domain-containing protein [Desulfobacteraceae bacterium]